MSLRPISIVNLVYEMNCKYVLLDGEASYISWWAYVFVRLESLSVEGQEPDFCTCNDAHYY